MDPNQPQPQQPYQTPQPPVQGTPLDYLNQIAPDQQKRSFLGSLKPIHYIFVGIIALLLFVLLIGLALRGTGATPVTNMEHLMARLQTTQTIATNADKTIKNGSLAAINSNLDIYLVNTNRDITTTFKAVGVTSASIDKTITASEKGTALSSRLEDARLNAVFDSTYAREMSYQLSTVMTLMKSIYQATSDSHVKNFLQTAYTNLQPTQQSFDSFSTTTE